MPAAGWAGGEGAGKQEAEAEAAERRCPKAWNSCTVWARKQYCNASASSLSERIRTSEEKACGERWSTDSLSLSTSVPAAPAPSTGACAGAGAAAAAAAASPLPAPLAEEATCMCGRIVEDGCLACASGSLGDTNKMHPPFRSRPTHRAGGVGADFPAQGLLSDVEPLAVLLPGCQQQAGGGCWGTWLGACGQEQPAGLPSRPPQQAAQHVGAMSAACNAPSRNAPALRK